MAAINQTPRIIILAGPNGAGKTTFARSFLPREGGCLNFINADLIAAGLSPFRPESAALQAGRVMLAEINRFVTLRTSFAFETTLSGRTYAHQIPQWRAAGFTISLVYLKLASVELAIARVRERVAQGGHQIPEDVIRRRFTLGLVNLQDLYATLVDTWAIYDNNGSRPILVKQGTYVWPKE